MVLEPEGAYKDAYAHLPHFTGEGTEAQRGCDLPSLFYIWVSMMVAISTGDVELSNDILSVFLLQ